MKEYISVSIKVIGKVQGVWFRASTKETAKRLNIYGFVRNEKNGNVYIEAQGLIENMQHFQQWCNKGPEQAMVENIIVETQEFKNYTSFEIL